MNETHRTLFVLTRYIIYMICPWIGSCETRQLNRNLNTNRSRMYLCKSNNFYLPCKFTVQVVLLPRSNTTTLVAAAIVSVCLFGFFLLSIVLFQCLVSRYCAFTCVQKKTSRIRISIFT